MATVQPIITTRFAHQFVLESGAGITIESDLAWTSIAVDYGNEGDENDPPSMSYINLVDDSATGVSYGQGNKVVAMLPLSFEFVLDTVEEEEESSAHVSVKWINRRIT